MDPCRIGAPTMTGPAGYHGVKHVMGVTMRIGTSSPPGRNMSIGTPVERGPTETSGDNEARRCHSCRSDYRFEPMARRDTLTACWSCFLTMGSGVSP